MRKRAHEATSRNPITAGLEKKNEATNEDQPPLKKYRALFEETDPDRVESQYVQSGLSNGGIADSQLFSDMPNESQSAGVIGGLSVVPEEAEEGMPAGVSTSDAPPNAIERDADESPLSPRKKPEKPLSVASEAGPSQLQRPPVSSTQMSTMSKTASSKTGAAPGKPDTDADFLKALASTKKGKRREDEFDREFNNLRISVPEREKDERAEEWKLLADFGDESNLLGNFMVIMEMDVPERGRHHSNSFGESSRAQIRDIESPAWRDKPNFKKFKKVKQTPDDIIALLTPFSRKQTIDRVLPLSWSLTTRMTTGWVQVCFDHLSGGYTLNSEISCRILEEWISESVSITTTGRGFASERCQYKRRNAATTTWPKLPTAESDAESRFPSGVSLCVEGQEEPNTAPKPLPDSTTDTRQREGEVT